MFKRLKIVQLLLAATVIPLVFSVIGFTLWVSNINQSVDEAATSFETVQLMQDLDSISKSFAVERGLTAGYLGSPSDQARTKLLAQRAKADAALATLLQASDGRYSSISSSLIAKVIDSVRDAANGLGSIRSSVDNGNSPKAFSFYTNINEQALTQFANLALTVHDINLRHDLRIGLDLLNIREEAGKIRGKLNGVFAKGETSAQTFVEIAGFISNEQKALNNILRDGNPILIEQINTFEKTAHWLEISQVSNKFISDSKIDNVQGPNNWFELATKRIGDIGTLAGAIMQNVYTDAESASKEGQRIIQTTLLGLAAVFGGIIFFVIVFNRSLTARVQNLQNLISRINKENDLAIRLPAEGRDEFSTISKQMNGHLDHIADAFYEIQTLIKHNVDNLDEAKGSTSKVSQSVMQQNQMSESIAVAIEEMSQTIESIANSMKEAATHTAELVTSCTEGHNKVNETTEIMVEVKSQIDSSSNKVTALSNDIASVSALLADIEQIAEQTNLLALNAAIEAARAGEQGRGFAVVADEVRNLAQRTQKSTEQVKSILSSLDDNSAAAIAAMETNTRLVNESNEKVAENSAVIEGLFDAISKINAMIEETATASEQQAMTTEDINRNVVNAGELSASIVELANDANHGVTDTLKEFEIIQGRIQEFSVK